MTKNQYITNVSPIRDEIIAALKKKKMKTSEVAELFNLGRERVYNILNNLNRHMLIGKERTVNSIVWGSFTKPADKPLREMPVNNGTIRGILKAPHLETPYRAGSMDAFSLPSGARA